MGHRQSLLEYDLVLLLLRLFAVVCRHHDNLSVLIYFNSRNRESGLLRCSNSATQIRLFEHHHECKATVAKKQARACLFTVIGGSAMKKIIAGPARNNSVETALAGHALPTSAGNCPTAGGRYEFDVLGEHARGVARLGGFPLSPSPGELLRLDVQLDETLLCVDRNRITFPY